VSREVHAAGGVVVRDGHVVVVHRPKYDDWSLPKGKLEPGESFEEAALREVAEETGLRCELDGELGSVRYIDPRGRPKLVRYWRMRPLDEAELAPTHEIDEARWVDRDGAAELLDYAHDKDLVDSAL
jgi:8-oxo-dGTP diphosphatase